MRKNHLSFLLCLILAFTVCFTPLFTQAETTTAAQNANLSITAKPKETTLVGTNKTTITYTITNTGNVRLTNVVLKDEDIAGSKTIGSVDTLNVGASKTYTYEASFTRTSTSKPVVTCKADGKTKTFTGANQKIVMGASKLSATLKADSTKVESGKKNSFTLTLKNDGTSTISNIIIANSGGTTLKEKIAVRAGNSTNVTFEDTVSEGEYYVTVSGKDSSGNSVEAESNKVNMIVETTTTQQKVDVQKGLVVTLSSDKTSLEKADKVKLTIELENTTDQEYKNIEIIDKATNKSIQTVDTLAAGDTKTLTSEIDLKETTKFQYQVKAKAEDGTEVSLDSNTVEVTLNKEGMSMMTIFLIIIAVIVVLIIITGTTLFVLSRKEKKRKKEAASRISQKYRPQPGVDDTPQNGFIPEQPSGGTPLSTFTIEPEDQPSQQTMPLNIPKQSSDFSTSDYEPHPAVEQPQRPVQAPPVTPPPQQGPPVTPPPQQVQQQAPPQPQQPPQPPKSSPMDYNDLDPDR